MKVILHLLPQDLYLKGKAAKNAILLRYLGFWKRTDYEHGAVLTGFPGIPESTDYVTSLLNFGANNSVRFPDHTAWSGQFGLREDAISVFTDGSKIKAGTGSGVYLERLNLSCSVFQAEVLALCDEIKVIVLRELTKSNIVLYSDSRAALGALAVRITYSKYIRECREALNDLALRYDVEFCWLPGHSDIERNELADELSRAG